MGNKPSTFESGPHEASAIPTAVPVVEAEAASNQSPIMASASASAPSPSPSTPSPQSETGITVTTSTEFSVYPASETANTLVGINMTGCAAPSDTDRAPVDVVVVADVSGSMAGSKMTLLKDTLRLLLGDLVAKDRVGLVTFDSYVKEPFPLQTLTSQAKSTAEGVVDKLRAGSATNLSGGLFQGIQQLINQSGDAKNSKKEEGAPRCRTVLLMTDGQANNGLKTSAEIVPIVTNMLKDTGIGLHTFGYGSDHDSGLLRDIAAAGSGSYYFVEGVDDIRGAFGDCLGGLLSVVAQNLELTVAAAGGASITKVHHNNAVAAGPGRWKLKYSDLYGEEQRDLLVSVALPKSSVDGAMDVLSSSLSYIDVLAGTPEVVRNTVAVQRSTKEISSLDQNRDARLELQSTRLQVAETLTSARAAAEKGDLKSARALVSKTRGEVSAVSARCASVEGAEAMLPTFMEDLTECEDGLTDQRTFYSKQHKMTMLAEGHMQQRCMESASVSLGGGGGSALRSNAYRTKAKKAKASAWLS